MHVVSQFKIKLTITDYYYLSLKGYFRFKKGIHNYIYFVDFTGWRGIVRVKCLAY